MSALGGTYLGRIVEDVRARLDDELARPVPVAAPSRPRSFVAGIAERRIRGELGVVGEVKRRSPSVGEIAAAADPGAQAARYDRAGAAGISVLTERDHFGGSLDDLAQVRAATDAPVLRKDFLLDPRQLEVARGAGADAVLLIAAIHDDAALASLVAHAHGCGLEVLLEVHDATELERALATEADMIGINNRDLRSFVVDLATTERLAPLVTDGRPVVAESGVRTPEDAARMRRAGVDALLVGEALMRAADPGRLLRALATAQLAAGAPA